MTQKRQNAPQSRPIQPTGREPQYDPAVVDTARSNLVPANYAKAQKAPTVVETSVPSMGTRGTGGPAVAIAPDGSPALIEPELPAE